MLYKKKNRCSVYSSGKNCSRYGESYARDPICGRKKKERVARRERTMTGVRASAAKGAESETDARHGERPSWFATDGVRFGRDGGERDNDTFDPGASRALRERVVEGILSHGGDRRRQALIATSDEATRVVDRQ